MSDPLLTICILTLDERKVFYERIRSVIDPQVIDHPVSILTVQDNRENTIGHKRQFALDTVQSEYICFIDDDDVVSTDYVDAVMDGLKSRPDALGIRGVMTEGNHHAQYFVNHHGYDWEDKPRSEPAGITWYRPVNHLNPIRTEIARKIGYESISHGEDRNYSIALKQSGLIQYCPLLARILYFYQFRRNK